MQMNLNPDTVVSLYETIALKYGIIEHIVGASLSKEEIYRVPDRKSVTTIDT